MGNLWCRYFHRKFHAFSGHCRKCLRWPPKYFFLLFLLFSPSLQAQDYKILNFDKMLVGTDKLIYMQPPPGKYWTILQGSLMIEQPVPTGTFMLWMENAPYAPYRDPLTGEMRGCERCVTLSLQSTANRIFFPFKGQSMPIIITYPNRLMAVITPPHGGWEQAIPTYTRIVVIEKDLP